MKRALWIAALSIIMLMAAVASTFLMRSRANADQKEAPELPTASRSGEEAAEADKPGDSPKPADGPNANAKQSDASPKTVQQRGPLLETIGCLTSAHYFQTYLNIGFIADGKSKGTYADRDARKLLDSVLSVLSSVENKLDGLAKIELDPGDRERLEQLRALSALLRQQGKELHAYWDTGKDENAAKYESLRRSAWATISELMGIGQ